jgi:hypothetical protein
MCDKTRQPYCWLCDHAKSSSFFLYYTTTDKSLNTLIGNGNRFMAYSLVKKLQPANKKGLFELLRKSVESKDRARGKNTRFGKQVSM